MTDLKRHVEDGQGNAKPEADRQRHAGSRTAGTDRDFDESRTSDNQGHGHPREERRKNEHQE